MKFDIQQKMFQVYTSSFIFMINAERKKLYLRIILYRTQSHTIQSIQ